MTSNHVDIPKINHLSLCSGYGGFDLGLKRAIPGLRTVAYSEVEASAIECLLARMEKQELDEAPIWSDLRTFPWEAFRGLVDIVSGGYPCQPFSCNGKKQGEWDARHLWPYIANGVRVVRPAWCIFENVEGHVALGLRDVIDDLGSMGYRATWGLFSALEAGSPQLRQRVYIVAHDPSQRVEGVWPSGEQEPRLPVEEVLSGCSGPRSDWSDGTPQPILVRMADGGPEWVDRIRLLGNAVIPAMAEIAFRTLARELCGSK
jgi:DNA (cytosine-5)-methyltransferase 1